MEASCNRWSLLLWFFTLGSCCPLQIYITVCFTLYYNFFSFLYLSSFLVNKHDYLGFLVWLTKSVIYACCIWFFFLVWWIWTSVYVKLTSLFYNWAENSESLNEFPVLQSKSQAESGLGHRCLSSRGLFFWGSWGMICVCLQYQRDEAFDTTAMGKHKEIFPES